ncbi:MAG: MSCRAMM family protein [Eggerthellaceae bacterium]
MAQFTTDENGHGQTDSKVKNGTYTVKEISAPDGYVLSKHEYKVTVSGKDAGVDASDAPITVKIKVVKTDAETGKPEPQGAGSLDGAVYKAVYQKNGETVSQEATVENGEATFEGIPLGEMSITETHAPDRLPPGHRDPRVHRHCRRTPATTSRSSSSPRQTASSPSNPCAETSNS